MTGQPPYEVNPIGIIHSPLKKKEETPIQSYRSAVVGDVEVFKEFAAGLRDLEGFSHITLLYLFHGLHGYELLVRPFLDSRERGLFSTRHPHRPNPIGLSTVRLIKRMDNILQVAGVDVLDGTPLLDIKPYVPVFDERSNIKIGWLSGKI